MSEEDFAYEAEFGRGMSVNRVPKVREIIEMVHECLDELRRMNGEVTK